jgi:hypothetical protein
MKINYSTCKAPLTAGALSILLAAAGSAMGAGTFQYNPSDVVIGFRATSGGGSYELVVDAGSISNFLALSSGQTMTVANVTSTLLNDAFPAGLNDLSWAVFADTTTNNVTVGSSNYPPHSLWMSAPRADINSQSTPYYLMTYIGNGNVTSQIEGLGKRAVAYAASIPASQDNTTTAIRLPTGSSLYSYSAYIGSGNFNGTMDGYIEQFTGDTFTADGISSRADLYAMPPAPSAYTYGATYLGYFDFGTNGILTYTAGPSSVVVTAPQIISITRSGNTTSITFGPTSIGVNYSLVSSSNLLTPKSNWSPVGSAQPGTGANITVNDTTSNAQTFYTIKAQ